MQLANERITAVPWAMSASVASRPFSRVPTGLESHPALMLFVVLVAAIVGGTYLARRYLPAMRALRGGLANLPVRRYEPLLVSGADELRGVVEGFNRTTMALHEQFRALETLGEIDKLLLGSAELEQVLDAVLSRVQAVTRCDCVGITLRDADAPGRGRVYLAGSGLTDLPVRRVELDDDMITTLAGESGGLTVTRCEDARHSFLKPLKEIGAEFFWVWPVRRVRSGRGDSHRRLSRGACYYDPYLASSGTQFAERLARCIVEKCPR